MEDWEDRGATSLHLVAIRAEEPFSRVRKVVIVEGCTSEFDWL